jgi:hypothetical protein
VPLFCKFLCKKKAYNIINFLKELFMGNHEADIQNPNKGTPGTNPTYDHNQGNRGKQLNPNQPPGHPAPNHGNRGGGGNGNNGGQRKK